jgi:hypothetical protein
MRPDPDLVAVPPSEPKLLDQLRGRLRVKHYSIRTEQSYVDWVRRFVLFHGKRHPRDLGLEWMRQCMAKINRSGIK